MLFKSKNFSVLCVNLIGMIAFLLIASQFWAPTGEEDLPVAFGDAFGWTIEAGSVLIIYLMINAVWLICIIWGMWKGRNAYSVLHWLFVAFLWVTAVCIDASHHYVG